MTVRPSPGRRARTRPGGRLKEVVPATAEIRRRRDLASRMIRAANGPLVVYGSSEWHQLPETDRRRIAAVVTAAECWQQGCDDVPGRLRQEIPDARDANAELDAADFAHVAAKVRRLASVPTFAELCDRRGEPERAAPARAHAERIREDAS